MFVYSIFLAMVLLLLVVLPDLHQRRVSSVEANMEPADRHGAIGSGSAALVG